MEFRIPSIYFKRKKKRQNLTLLRGKPNKGAIGICSIFCLTIDKLTEMNYLEKRQGYPQSIRLRETTLRFIDDEI